jgi:hypothetical protein
MAVPKKEGLSMNALARTFTTGCFGIALVAACASADAQSLDKLKGMMGGGSSSTLTSGSTSNAAGIIQYCMKNNYLGGDSGAAAVKDKLLGKAMSGSGTSDTDRSNPSTASKLASKLSGKSSAKPDSGYADGANGILKTSDGKQVSLGGSGLKAQLTEKACDIVLKQGKSMIGM